MSPTPNPRAKILAKLGEGGMGVVYKAHDAVLDRVVAIKLLPSESVADPDRKPRFMQEAQAASALNHPGIVTIHDITAERLRPAFGEEEGLHSTSSRWSTSTARR